MNQAPATRIKLNEFAEKEYGHTEKNKGSEKKFFCDHRLKRKSS
jgi:hypothetical protein